MKDVISFVPNKLGPLSTTEIFKAFNSWAQKHDLPVSSNVVVFGAQLKAFLNHTGAWPTIKKPSKNKNNAGANATLKELAMWKFSDQQDTKPGTKHHYFIEIKPEYR